MVKDTILTSNTASNTDPQVVDREKLKAMFATYSYHLGVATGRKERLEKLMGRKCAQKWPAQKKAKMVKRFIQSSKEFQELHEAVDFIEHKLAGS